MNQPNVPGAAGEYEMMNRTEAANELARRIAVWSGELYRATLKELPDRGAYADTHTLAGASVELVLPLYPARVAVVFNFRLIDSNGEYERIAQHSTHSGIDGVTTFPDALRELAVRVAMAAADMYAVMAAGLPDRGAWVQAHVQSGARVELLLQLVPSIHMGFRLVDTDGTYTAIAVHQSVVPPLH